MSRRVLIFLGVVCALIAGIVAGYWALPKRYTVGERLSQANVFWNDDQAFLFVQVSTTGRVSNEFLERLQKSRFASWAILLGGGPRFTDQQVRAFRWLPSGELKQFPVPDGSATYGDWTLKDGKLELYPPENSYAHLSGFRWDGEKFVAVPAEPKSEAESARGSRLAPDDDAEEEDGSTNFLRPAARKAFKDAGWHYKQLPGYEIKSTQAILPITLGENSYELTIHYFPLSKERGFEADFLKLGIQSLTLSNAAKPGASQTIWTQGGWQALSKSEFEKRARRSGRSFEMGPYIWIWLGIVVLLAISKFSGWVYLASRIFGTKQRVLRNMATSYSFPPATPSQFPKLDTAELERYTSEFASLGFVQLADISLVSNSSKAIPNFGRIFVHTRHHCFAEVSQIFPRWKPPMALRCSIQSCLQDGWTVSFSNRKPLAASSLLRWKKAIGVSMPNVRPYELLQGFLQMREQVCQDLGVSVVKDDTIDAYFAKLQRNAADAREAVQQKNFATGIPEFYYRKFALLKTEREYVWLGDYPKVAEQRKQGTPVAV